MNCATYSDPRHSYLVAGQEGHCQLYNVQTVVVSENEENEKNDHELRRRKSNGIIHDEKPLKTDKNKNNKRLKFVIKPSDSIQTDFSKDEPIQRVVRLCHNGKFMATGGTDCNVRLWKFPSMKQHKILKAHSKEIDDIDFSQYDNWVITIAKDGLAILWDYMTGKEIKRLTWNHPEGTKYLFKRCR